MKISKEMIEQIAVFEGCKLQAYRDIAGVPTIGIGHTGDDVAMGDKISKEEAIRLFSEDVAQFETIVNNLNAKISKKYGWLGGFSQKQFDALVSLVYNTGASAISSSSTIYRLMMNGGRNNHPDVCHAFMLWVKYTDPATKTKKVSRGLENRRAREAAWYVYGANWETITQEKGIVDIVEWAKG